MEIKKYTGKTIQEAMDMFRDELGKDGVILSTKTIKEPGIFGFLKKHKYEITAAYEKEEIMDEFKEDIKDLKGIVSEIKLSINRQEELPEEIKKYHRIMVKNGVDFNIAFSILKSISQEINLSNKNDNEISEIIKFKLGEIFKENNPIEISKSQKSIFFVGPTGVGKTTTLAKIASNLVMEQKYNMGLITSDTYRVGAVDQLKIYSDILSLPIEISYDKDDLLQAFDKFIDKDIVLVDTAGRNYNDEEHINQLKDILDIQGDKSIFVLISATSDMKLLQKLVTRYNFLGDYKIVVTKIDEANDLGSLFNIKYLFDKEIAYYTVGQNVPEDISTIDKDYILDYLIKEH